LNREKPAIVPIVLGDPPKKRLRERKTLQHRMAQASDGDFPATIRPHRSFSRFTRTYRISPRRRESL
jgi:hypothetical protein